MKGEDIIHHNLLRGGGATHNHLNTTIEGKEQFYYYKHVMFLSDIELVQIFKLMNTNINLFLVIYPFFITLYLLLYFSNVSHRHRVREREYSYSPSPDRKRGSKRPKREKKHKRRSPSASPSLSPPPKISNHY